MRVSGIEMIRQPEWNSLMIRVTTNAAEISGMISPALTEVGAYMEEVGAMPAGVPYVCLKHYEHIDPARIELEIGFPVVSRFPGRGEIRSVTFPERQAVFALFRGDYSQMKPLYEDVAAWLEEHGKKSTGDAFEFYYNGPPFPMEEMITKVLIPIE